MQAIHIKYFGPTNNRAARIKATAGAGSITVSRHSTIDGIELDSLTMDKAALKVAEQFARKFKWDGPWHGGTLKDGTMVFVNAVHEFESFTVERVKA